MPATTAQLHIVTACKLWGNRCGVQEKVAHHVLHLFEGEGGRIQRFSQPTSLITI